MKHGGNSTTISSPGGDADDARTESRRSESRSAREPRSGDVAWQGSRPCATCARLTSRELWIVAQLVKHKGAPNKVIASTLNISPNTLRNHLASIYAKLGVRRRLDLVLYAMEHGLDGSAHA